MWIVATNKGFGAPSHRIVATNKGFGAPSHRIVATNKGFGAPNPRGRASSQMRKRQSLARNFEDHEWEPVVEDEVEALAGGDGQLDGALVMWQPEVVASRRERRDEGTVAEDGFGVLLASSEVLD